MFLLVVTYFNSIKVQLEQEPPNITPTELSEFQFHKGTIRTSQKLILVLQSLLDFNSIKVQLEHYISRILGT